MKSAESPTSAVRGLLADGMTEKKIVTELRKQFGVRTSQPTINRIKRGATKSTDFRLGMGLIQLRQRVSAQAAQG